MLFAMEDKLSSNFCSITSHVKGGGKASFDYFDLGEMLTPPQGGVVVKSSGL